MCLHYFYMVHWRYVSSLELAVQVDICESLEKACNFDSKAPSTFTERVEEAPHATTKKAKKREQDIQKAKEMVSDPVKLLTRNFATDDQEAAARVRAAVEKVGQDVQESEAKGAAAAKKPPIASSTAMGYNPVAKHAREEIERSAAVAKKAKMAEQASDADAKDDLAKTIGSYLSGSDCHVDMGDGTVDSLIESLPIQQQELFDAA